MSTRTSNVSPATPSYNVATAHRVQFDRDQIKITNVKPGDRIEIFQYRGQSHISINDRVVSSFAGGRYFPRINLYGDKLTRDNVTVHGQPGTSSVRLYNDARRLQDEFTIHDEKPKEEKNLFQKFADSGVGLRVNGHGGMVTFCGKF